MSLTPQLLLSKQAREHCISKFKSLPSVVLKPKGKKRAAVLIPLCAINNEVHLLYTLRSMNLKNHSGQISFPGGKMDGEEKIVDTALRETEEEIGVVSDAIDVWCKMPPVQGRDKELLITPVVGVINNFDLNSLRPNPLEVDKIFTVSMENLCNKDNHGHFLFNGLELPIFIHGRHKIWGITGFITDIFLRNFLPEGIYDPDFSKKEYTLDELLPSKL